ncbi:DUF2569 domain-containing protein [Paenibacillus ihumii]|uniref:DUF2569 domain-containing protein n=1 Tax=Paenibacillus ihumii TaxID=687436 RepID=UPI0006D81BDE|nr:DUF2569 domain-containing protein [Paenibacillus ihumii]
METYERQKQTEEPPLGVAGLGGWLVLVQISLYLSIITRVGTLLQSLPLIAGPDTGHPLTSPGSPLYHPLWKTSFMIEGITSAGMLIFTIFILVSFYQKKRILPRMMIMFYILNFLLLVTIVLLVNQIPLAKEVEGVSGISTIIGGLAGCAIWIPYFLKSERVRNTFRN